jgi:predicted nucleic acid-binding protein
VAFLSKDDHHHDRVMEVFPLIREPMLTVWPVIAEVMYLLRTSLQAQEGIWEFLEADALLIADLAAEQRTRMRHLMRKYRDLPMDLADAGLVAVAERERISRIFTLDRRNFEVYRPTGIRRFDIIP